MVERKDCKPGTPMPALPTGESRHPGEVWTHHDVVETSDGDRYVWYKCLTCGHHFSIDFGD